jgi:hypothetical protein
VLSVRLLSGVVRVLVAGGFILWSAALTSRPTGPNRQLLGFSLQCLDIDSPSIYSPALGPVVSIVRDVLRRVKKALSDLPVAHQLSLLNFDL